MNNLEKKAKNIWIIMIQLLSFHPRSHHCPERDIWRETSWASQLLDIKFSRLIDKYTTFFHCLFNKSTTIFHGLYSYRPYRNVVKMSSKYVVNFSSLQNYSQQNKETRTTATMVNAYYSSMNGIWNTYLWCRTEIIIQEYFQAKIVRKIRIFSLGRI